MSTYANSNYNPGSVLKWIRNPPRSINLNDPQPHPLIHQSFGELSQNPLFAKKFLQAQSNPNKIETGIANSSNQKWKHGFFPSLDDAARYISEIFTNSTTQPLVRALLLRLDNGQSNRESFRVNWNHSPFNVILTERPGGQNNAIAPGPATVTTLPVQGIFVLLKTSSDPDYPVLQTCFPYDAANAPNNPAVLATL